MVAVTKPSMQTPDYYALTEYQRAFSYARIYSVWTTIIKQDTLGTKVI